MYIYMCVSGISAPGVCSWLALILYKFFTRCCLFLYTRSENFFAFFTIIRSLSSLISIATLFPRYKQHSWPISHSCQPVSPISQTSHYPLLARAPKHIARPNGASCFDEKGFLAIIFIGGGGGEINTHTTIFPAPYFRAAVCR